MIHDLCRCKVGAEFDKKDSEQEDGESLERGGEERKIAVRKSSDFKERGMVREKKKKIMGIEQEEDAMKGTK